VKKGRNIKILVFFISRTVYLIIDLGDDLMTEFLGQKNSAVFLLARKNKHFCKTSLFGTKHKYRVRLCRPKKPNNFPSKVASLGVKKVAIQSKMSNISTYLSQFIEWAV
jgi:hypothetical protein